MEVRLAPIGGGIYVLKSVVSGDFVCLDHGGTPRITSFERARKGTAQELEELVRNHIGLYLQEDEALGY
ncbi:hypothetical protein GF360_01335 [candidate division WWE3 bacterium]|nr:hypothetical protein [candidate division WWE3 bacterium]